MELVTTAAVIKCGHDGRIVNRPSQHWVRVAGKPVLVDSDPEQRSITACPNYGPAVKPCTNTLAVAAGYSGLVRIGRRRVVMSNLDGLTDGTVPGTVHYGVRDPGQAFVEADT